MFHTHKIWLRYGDRTMLIYCTHIKIRLCCICISYHVVPLLRTTMWLWFALGDFLVFSDFYHSFELPRLLEVNCFCRSFCRRLVQYEYEHELPYQKAEGRTDLQEALSEGAAPECVAFAPADCASNCKFHLCDVSLTGTGRNWAGIQITKKTLERRGDALAKKLFALKCRPLTIT